jgi:sodium-dependent dicarboxylate transporter 2/3/5
LGILAWMSIWWLTEAIPLGATALLPIALFPALGIASTRDTVSPYASDIVFLFLAGFLLAAGLEHWRAHARIAYGMIGAMGSGARRIVLGVMLATAFLSLWISNTATAAMMYPIALAVGEVFGTGDDAKRMRTALMLGVAYAASIGGMATLIGTPPNLIFAGGAREILGREVSFVRFMMVGFPIAAILLPLCWLLLVFVLFPGRVAVGADARAMLEERRRTLGRLSGGERTVLVVFGLTALGWLFRELLLFVLTGSRQDGVREPLLTWRQAKEIPWEVLLLFGGGLSLAAAMESTGLARWMGGLMTALGGYPSIVIFAGLALIVLVLSELASNTAVAAMAIPIAASLATAVGKDPLALMLVATLAASTGFALPVATPPNAIVFGSGQITVRQMAKAGVVLDLLAIAIVTLMVSLLHPLVFG